VPTITHVFNFGLPMKAEDYTHRIGRTGRAGRSGLAVTFAEIRDRRKIGDIEFYTKQPFQAEVIPGLEPKQRFDYPARKSFGGKGGGRGGRSDRGERGFGGQPKGWGNRGAERFEPRFDARRDAAPRQEPRFEGRQDRFSGERAHPGQFEPRFERRDDRAPRGFEHPHHAPRAQARAGGNERFGERTPRGPKLVGGGFKPHAPKRRG